MSIALSADTSMPPDNTVPSGQLAILSMFWPNDWDAEGAVNGRCPSPDFVPAAIQISFGSSGAVNVRNIPIGGRQLAICGQHISVEYVGLLTPG
jgi:hypothetical protein